MGVAVVQERMSGLPTIWLSMLSAPLLYAGIVLFMLPATPAAADLTLPSVLAALGFVPPLAAQVLWVQVKRGAFAGKTGAGGRPLQMPMVVWAIDESAGVFGLIIAFLGAPQVWSFTLFAVALVALLLNPYWTLEGAA
jgi:hypothetical protein